jgi:DNA-binding transcriptional ArsR family regulator
MERRKLRDPRELRALAHPVRLRLMQVLYERGTATATELAEPVGESPSNCSWHLRQLAKYGFVEEAGGTGRQRPWRPTMHSLSWGEGEESGEAAVASDELSIVFYEQEFAALRAWLARHRTEPEEWQDAAEVTQTLAWLTAPELKALNAEFIKIAERHMERIDPAKRPPGSRLIRMFAWAVPGEPLI